MFERVGSLAERVATDVSRRAFLGRLGGAVVLAGAMGAMLAFPGVGQAKGCPGPCSCCCYVCSDGRQYRLDPNKGACRDTYHGCPFVLPSACGC
jgi:hypothetical protein